MRRIAPHDRPREKLERLGPAGLGDNELVAIVLGQGSRHRTALDLANALLEAVGGVHGLTRVSRDRLRTVTGVGAARGAQVLAAVELGRRTVLRRPPERPQFASPREAAAFLIPQFAARGIEHFGLMLLDARHRLIKTALVSVGTLDCTVVHPREVFREATVSGAAALVLFHNHPSGDPTPSPEDVKLTWRMVQAGDVMGIEVVDHLVLADSRYFSFRESRRLRQGEL
jgi:DNA repair protein RadC